MKTPIVLLLLAYSIAAWLQSGKLTPSHCIDLSGNVIWFDSTTIPLSPGFIYQVEYDSMPDGTVDSELIFCSKDSFKIIKTK